MSDRRGRRNSSTSSLGLHHSLSVPWVPVRQCRSISYRLVLKPSGQVQRTLDLNFGWGGILQHHAKDKLEHVRLPCPKSSHLIFWVGGPCICNTNPDFCIDVSHSLCEGKCHKVVTSASPKSSHLIFWVGGPCISTQQHYSRFLLQCLSLSMWRKMSQRSHFPNRERTITGTNEVIGKASIEKTS